MIRTTVVLCAFCITILGAALDAGGAEMSAGGTALKERLDAYATVEIGVPWDALAAGDRAVLKQLYMAAAVMDELFLRQVDIANVDLREEIERGGDGDLVRFFRINFGAWDRLAGDEPVIRDAPKPLGAGFYPADVTRQEFEDWLSNHPSERQSFESNFTVIRRGRENGLKAVPYSVEYGELLEKAAGHLNGAAELTKNKSLADFLRLRAEAFMTDDYFESDMAWMDIRDNVLDVTIGPYEVYEDNLFNYKAAFEAFVCIRDPEESRKLDGLKKYLLNMEKNLPIEDGYKNLERGLQSPISVVDVVFTAGDTKAGVQTIAFNLPNDERVREAKGSKKVMLRNICRAKFDKILKPIASRVVSPELLPLVTFDAYFNHILLHEFSHGLGPGRIVLEDGTETTVNKALRETYSALEEAKADVVGLYNMFYLIDEGFFGKEFERQAAATFLAGFFRSVRFGAGAAHGRANMTTFNYMKERGAYRLDSSTGLWSLDFGRSREVVRELSNKILMLQARGDYDGTKAFLDRYGVTGEDVKESLAGLGGIPVDIEPVFAIEKELAAE